MTDLISDLADQIIALINSKPASPTKQEVETVLRTEVEQEDAGERCRVYGIGGHEFTLWGKDKDGLLCMPNDQWDVTGGSVRRCQCGAEKTD
jgi:hypothetical protein